MNLSEESEKEEDGCGNPCPDYGFLILGNMRIYLFLTVLLCLIFNRTSASLLFDTFLPCCVDLRLKAVSPRLLTVHISSSYALAPPVGVNPTGLDSMMDIEILHELLHETALNLTDGRRLSPSGHLLSPVKLQPIHRLRMRQRDLLESPKSSHIPGHSLTCTTRTFLH